MVLSDEKRDQIITDFIEIFKTQYGEEWKMKLTSPLKPSPIYQIAEQRGVNVSDVRKIRHQLLLCGELIEWYMLITAPLPTPNEFQLWPPE